MIGAALTAAEQRTLLRLLAKVQGAAAANSTTPAPHGAVRRRRG